MGLPIGLPSSPMPCNQMGRLLIRCPYCKTLLQMERSSKVNAAAVPPTPDRAHHATFPKLTKYFLTSSESREFLSAADATKYLMVPPDLGADVVEEEEEDCAAFAEESSSSSSSLLNFARRLAPVLLLPPPSLPPPAELEAGLDDDSSARDFTAPVKGAEDVAGEERNESTGFC